MSAITPHGGPGLRAPAAVEDNGQVELAADPTQALQPLIDGADMACSPTLGAWAGAMSAAQADMVNPAKNAVNPFFSKGGREARYADLGQMLAAARPALSAHGLALVQMTFIDSSGERPRATVASVVIHSSGEWLGARAGVDLQTMIEHTKGEGRGQSPLQVLASCNTYLRRIGAPGLVGLAPDDDDDGEGNAARAAAPANSDWRKRTSARNVQRKLDELLPSLSPDAAAWAKGKAESAANVTELSAILASAERRLATYQAQQQPAAPAPTTGREGPWLIGAAVAIGETDGNPEYGALLPPSVAVVPGDPVKVTMRGRQGRMRGVVTEVLDSTDEGQTVRTRKMTRAEETAVEERES